MALRPGASIVATGVLLALGAALVAWFLGRDDSLVRVQRAGVLRVGYSVEVPFAQVEPDGTVRGQSADCAVEVARALGVRVEWVQTPLDRQIPDLVAKRFDVVAAGLFISPERAAQVRFSLPTLRVRPAWLTRAASPAPTLAALRSGWDVVVVSGAAAERHLATLGLGERLHAVPDVRAGAAGLSRGLYQALALPWPAGNRLVAERPADFAVWPADDGRPDREVALAFRPEDKALAAAADAALAPWLTGAAYRATLAGFGLTTDDLPVRPGSAR